MIPRARSLERVGVPAGLIAAAVGYFMLVDGPTSRATAAAREETIARQATIREADHLTPQIREAQRELAEAQKHIAAWHACAPKASDVQVLYAPLHKALSAGGARVMQFDPQPVVTMAGLEQAPLAIALVGSQQAVVQALLKIEEFKATIWVRDVRLSRIGEDAKKIQFEAKLVIFADQGENSH